MVRQMVWQELKDKRVLITGALGFVGLNLLSQLQEANEVFSTDMFQKENIPSFFPLDVDNYHQLNLTDRNATIKLIESIEPNYIIHLAASTDLSRTFDAVYKTLEANIHGTLHIYEAVSRIKSLEHLIVLSTSDVYGQISPPFKEDVPLYPASPYSVSKASVEMYGQMLYRIHELPVTILRSFNLFGAMQKPIRLIPYLITNLLMGKPVPLTKGEQKREYNHVSDLISVIAKILPRTDTYGDVFNVGSGKSISIREVAKMIGNMLGGTHLLNFGELPYRENEIWDMRSSTEKLRERIGWSSQISLEEGLEQTVEWYRAHYEQWKDYLVGTAT